MNRQPDDLAEARYRSLLSWRRRWTALVFAVGVAATVFLILAITMFIRQAWLPGAISTVVSLLGGGGVKWLEDRRREAASEEQRAFGERQETLDKAGASREVESSRDVLMGRKNKPRG